ncbi:GNAT family N-acetyltransferase [Planctomycetota bacterium]
MAEDADLPKARDMTLDDLDGVVKVHRDCFPSSVSIFSALDDSILKAYYAQFVEESESYAAVLEQPGSGLIVGVTFGTRKPGIQGRFLHTHRFEFLLSVLKGLLTSKAMWGSLWSRLRKTNALPLGEYDSELAAKGVPVPQGVEDLNMGIAIHSKFRGGGNAKRLIEYYTARIFEIGATKIRGAILTKNIASMTFFKRHGWKFKEISDTQVSVWIDRPDSDS